MKVVKAIQIKMNIPQNRLGGILARIININTKSFMEWNHSLLKN